MSTLIEVSIPFSGSVENVEINVWAVKEGADVVEGDILADVSTDKVDTELEAPAAGRVVRFLVEEGTEVKVGTSVLLLAAPGATDEDVAADLAAYQPSTGA
ncbi:biotin/lipoyl-containing protein [Klenkia sp. LSe6-5]|uniref:Biotin/lipoyl-containing protein n=1 Tax=Klenkia sesuvii TaxID=3103137 RepID=A0ABU8DWD7_9ACTN